jgi:type III secretion system low calcium response chaperone LcrH/SycD
MSTVRTKPEELAAQLRAQGTTLAESQGMNPATLEQAYRVGYNAYNAGDNAAALKMFRFLVAFDHLNPRNWLGLAATLQRLGRFEDAALNYSMVSILTFGDPDALTHAAECWLHAGDRDMARALLGQAVDLGNADRARWAAAIGRAEALSGLLQQA